MTGIEFDRRSLFAAGAIGAGGLLLAGCATPASGEQSSTNGLPNTSPNPVVDVLATQRIVPVLRDPTPDAAMRTAHAWIAAGCKAIELTTTTPDVFHVAQMLANDGVTVGIGTLHSVDQVNQAADSGASFALSFATWPGLISAATERGMVPIPGTMTPTEVVASLAAPVVKIFPARLLGVDYLRTLMLLLPGLRTQVAGAETVEPAQARTWLDAGATFIGVDGNMFGPGNSGNSSQLTSKAREYVHAALS
ncbi:MAG: bifunctional 4-hydroxy-2-oxoglutarate aldolase/2-dehydro-3-deoxy-phosphogluconate aldolase [Actinomycetes bacterium]